MLKTIVKAVGIYAVAEVMFCLGKGYMIGCVRKYNPEVGESYADVVEEFVEDKDESPLRRMFGQCTLVGIKMFDIYNK